ncbi:MAG: hypothetical protein Q8O82_06215 [Pseudorhodobacter sp.]|nr:hypothetical protein [Pseudorhodobacter sp.]
MTKIEQIAYMRRCGQSGCSPADARIFLDAEIARREAAPEGAVFCEAIRAAFARAAAHTA